MLLTIIAIYLLVYISCPATQTCPTCLLSYDSGLRRKLLDSCGHQRCFSCMRKQDECDLCPREGKHCRLSTIIQYHDYQGLPPTHTTISTSLSNIPCQETSASSRQPCSGSSVQGRSWVQRYNRRPNIKHLEEESRTQKTCKERSKSASRSSTGYESGFHSSFETLSLYDTPINSTNTKDTVGVKGSKYIAKQS